MRFRQLVGLGIAVVAGATFATDTASATPKPPDNVNVLIRTCIDVPNRDIGFGSTGDYVREVQCLLNWAISPATFDTIVVDGRYGSITRDKVIKFQQCANALGAGLVVDGRVGPQTAPHLEWWAAHSAYIC